MTTSEYEPLDPVNKLNNVEPFNRRELGCMAASVVVVGILTAAAITLSIVKAVF